MHCQHFIPSMSHFCMVSITLCKFAGVVLLDSLSLIDHVVEEEDGWRRIRRMMVRNLNGSGLRDYVNTEVLGSNCMKETNLNQVYK